MIRDYLVIVLLLVGAKNISGHFGYSRKHQHTWPREFKACAGKRQSPIALSFHKSVTLPWLPALEMIGYHDFLPHSVILTNNGHSAAMALTISNSSGRLPYIFGASLGRNATYEFEGLHFHWGAKNNRGSEHVVNGIRYPMEMHIVHRNTKYSKISEALKNEDGLAVLGIFFQLQQDDDNKELDPLIGNLPMIQWLHTKIELNVSLILASFLPTNTDHFYTYKGSLTTPPCNEVVTWIIFARPVTISFKQIGKFRVLSNGEGVLVDNYRHLQKIGKRKVYMRRVRGPGGILRGGSSDDIRADASGPDAMSRFWQ